MAQLLHGIDITDDLYQGCVPVCPCAGSIVDLRAGLASPINFVIFTLSIFDGPVFFNVNFLLSQPV